MRASVLLSSHCERIQETSDLSIAGFVNDKAQVARAANDGAILSSQKHQKCIISI